MWGSFAYIRKSVLFTVAKDISRFVNSMWLESDGHWDNEDWKRLRKRFKYEWFFFPSRTNSIFVLVWRSFQDLLIWHHFSLQVLLRSHWKELNPCRVTIFGTLALCSLVRNTGLETGRRDSFFIVYLDKAVLWEEPKLSHALFLPLFYLSLIIIFCLYFYLSLITIFYLYFYLSPIIIFYLYF